MKRVIIFIVACLVFTHINRASANEDWEGELKYGAATEYIDGTHGTNNLDEPVINLNITIKHKKTGLSGGIVSVHSPQDGLNNDNGDEIDLVGNYTFYNEKINTGYVYYNCSNFTDTKNDMHGFYVGAELPKFYNFTPYFYVEGDVPVNDEFVEGGIVYKFGFTRLFKISDTSPGLGLDLSFGGHDGAFGSRPEIIGYARLTIASTFEIMGEKVTPALNLQKRLGHGPDNGGLADNEGWLTLSVLHNLFK